MEDGEVGAVWWAQPVRSKRDRAKPKNPHPNPPPEHREREKREIPANR